MSFNEEREQEEFKFDDTDSIQEICNEEVVVKRLMDVANKKYSEEETKIMKERLDKIVKNIEYQYE